MNDYLDYLAHHGIPGQRWGIRRYQNKDGSLTAAGKIRMQGVTKQQVVERVKEKAGEFRSVEKKYYEDSINNYSDFIKRNSEKTGKIATFFRERAEKGESEKRGSPYRKNEKL